MRDDQFYYWNLGAVIEDICLNSGLTNADMTLNGDMSDVIKGLVVNGDEPASTTIQNLAITHFFDTASYGGRVHFIKRGMAPVVEINEDDVIFDDEPISYKRGEPIEVPMSLTLEYYDIEGGINTDLQVSTRGNDSRTYGEEKINTSEVMDANSAKTAIVKHHKILIEDQRGEVSFSLPKKYIYLTVGDVIKYKNDRFRIEKIELDLHQQNYICKYDRASIYRTKIDGIPVNKPTPPPSNVINKTEFEILDCNILDDRNDTLGVYFIVQRTSPAWYGAMIEVSYNNGQSWDELGVIEAEGVIGRITAPFDIHSVYYPDTKNKIIVELLDKNDNVESYSNFEQLNRQGYIIVGDEIISYGDATFIGDGIVELGHLLRGRRGSKVKAHSSGERVVFLNLGAVNFFEIDIYNLKRPSLIRCTSIGTVNASITKNFTLQGNSQKEQAPARFEAQKIGDNLKLTWSGIGKKGGGAQVRYGDYFLGFNLYTPNSTQAIFLSPSTKIYTMSFQAGVYKICAVNALGGESEKSEVKI